MYTLPLFETAASDWRPPSLDSLPDWQGAKRVAFDCETRDEHLKTLGPGMGKRKDSYVTGFSVAIEDGPSFYLPIRHDGGDNLPAEGVLRYLRAQAADYAGTLVGANLPYDLNFSQSDGITFPKVKMFRDVQIADPLINELHDSYSLDNIAKRWGLTGKMEDVLRQAAADRKLDPKKDMWRLPARFVGQYATEDAALPLRILRRQEEEIDNQDLWRVYDLESRLLPVLAKLRWRGVRVSLEKLAKVEEWALAEEAKALQTVYEATGVKIRVGDVWKADAMAPALQKLGANLKTTAAGKGGKIKYSVDKEAMASVDHPAARAMEWARKVNKVRTTFAASVRDHLIGDRIHCTFNQMRRAKEGDDGQDADEAGARFGRLSCEHPNLQQQPARDEFASMWRAIYLPEEGQLWSSNDYSQQEPRWAVHYACLSRSLIGHDAWVKAIEARDKYRSDPTTDNHQMMADMAGIKRKAAKEIYLGLSYGMGGPKMCGKLGLPTRMVVRDSNWVLHEVNSDMGKALIAQGARRFEAAGVEGQALLDTFDQKVPFIKRMAKACEKRAKEVGYITTFTGRRCRFPTDPHGNFDWTHKGFNRLIQGASADQTKTAMVECDAAGFDTIIQVHDEIAFSVRDRAEAEAAADVMRTCVPMELPSKVDVETGASWGESME